MPGAIGGLLTCMQLKAFSLGFVLVLCFSIGRALTLVSAGALAALSVRHLSQRWSGFSAFAQQAPYASATLILMVGLYTGWLGWHGLGSAPAPSAGISAQPPTRQASTFEGRLSAQKPLAARAPDKVFPSLLDSAGPSMATSPARPNPSA